MVRVGVGVGAKSARVFRGAVRGRGCSMGMGMGTGRVGVRGSVRVRIWRRVRVAERVIGTSVTQAALVHRVGAGGKRVAVRGAGDRFARAFKEWRRLRGNHIPCALVSCGRNAVLWLCVRGVQNGRQQPTV